MGFLESSISGLAFVDGAEEEREANGVLVK